MSGTHRKLLLPCTCAGCCGVLGVDDWGDDYDHSEEPWMWSVEFYSRWGVSGHRFRHRLKIAWAILRGREHHVDCVCLDGDGLRQLRDFIDLRPPPVRFANSNTVTSSNWPTPAWENEE